MIKLVVFDLGGVVVNFSEGMYEEYISKKLGIPISKAIEIEKNIPKLEVRGMTVREYRKEALQTMHLAPNTNIEWDPAFMKLASTNKKVESLVRRLHKRYRTALITNVSASRYFLAIKHKFDKSIFDRRFTSYELRLRKPDPRIYRHVLREMNTKPAESVFIDNTAENARGAEAVGMHGIVFKNYDQLVKDLKKLGVH